jgi:menaquinone-dependent protoporphyrinogen IX oxidase
MLFLREERTKMVVLIVYVSKHGSTQGIVERIAEQFRQLGKKAVARPMHAVEDPESYGACSTEQRRKSKRTRQENQNLIFRLQTAEWESPVALMPGMNRRS